jgi:hypothetical protein
LGHASVWPACLGLSAAAAAVLHTRIPAFGEQRGRILTRGHKNLDLLLYVGAALLVSGILEVRAFYSWGEAYLSPDEGKLCLEAAGRVSPVAGGFFSFVLALIYLPASYVLDRAFEELPRPKSDIEPKDGGNWPSTFFRIAAILAPIIAGSPLNDNLFRY